KLAAVIDRLLGSRKERLTTLEVSNLLASQLEGVSLSSLRQLLLGDLRFFRRAHTPAKSEDEISSNPGGHQQSGRRAGQQSEASFQAGRRANQRDESGGVDQAVDGGRHPGRMPARNALGHFVETTGLHIVDDAARRVARSATRRWTSTTNSSGVIW